MIVHPTVTNEEAKTLFPDHTIHMVKERSLTADSSVDIFLIALPEDYPPQGRLDGAIYVEKPLLYYYYYYVYLRPT